MRRAASLLALLVCAPLPVLAQEDTLEQRLWSRDYQVPEGRAEIQTRTASLSSEERESLYNRFAVSPWWMAANLYPGFPVGSVIQGDLPVAINIGLTTWTGILLAAFANFDHSSSPTWEIMTYGGYAVAAFGYGWALVEPWLFADGHNRNLREALAGPP